MFPNPYIFPIYFDSCAFDGGDESEQRASLLARKEIKENGAGVEILHSVLKEIEFPNTPREIKQEAQRAIFTYEVELNATENAQLSEVENIIVGNGSFEKMKNDSRHVFEAFRHGGHYFITTDIRLLKKAGEIKSRFSLNIIKPTRLLELLEANEPI